jgi:hypothetical protein
MSNSRKFLPRRTFLRGIGAAVALLFLDAMSPALAASAKSPVRLAFLYVPNGIDMASWNVQQDGPFGDLPRILHDDPPTLLIGRGGNTLEPGRRVTFRKETPMANLHLTLMDKMGVHVESFGDASGRLEPACLG